MNLRPLLLIFMVVLTGAPSPSKAQAEADLVELRSVDAAYASYRDRRSRHGFLLGVNFENYYPSEYISQIDGATYADMFANNPVPLVGIEVGYKFNFVLGSVGLIYGYSFGSLLDDTIGVDRKIEFHRNSLKLMYTMDRLFAEPYAAPYLAVGMIDFGIDETDFGTETSFSGQSKFGTSLTVGVLIQLNWIEPYAARDGYMGAGLENTYLDLFVTQHAASSSGEDPPLGSAFDWGAGLRLEF